VKPRSDLRERGFLRVKACFCRGANGGARTYPEAALRRLRYASNSRSKCGTMLDAAAAISSRNVAVRASGQYSTHTPVERLEPG
jgi:hypothetical protein